MEDAWWLFPGLSRVGAASFSVFYPFILLLYFCGIMEVFHIQSVANFYICFRWMITIKSYQRPTCTMFKCIFPWVLIVTGMKDYKPYWSLQSLSLSIPQVMPWIWKSWPQCLTCQLPTIWFWLMELGLRQRPSTTVPLCCVEWNR